MFFRVHQTTADHSPQFYWTIESPLARHCCLVQIGVSWCPIVSFWNEERRISYILYFFNRAQPFYPLYTFQRGRFNPPIAFLAACEVLYLHFWLFSVYSLSFRTSSWILTGRTGVICNWCPLFDVNLDTFWTVTRKWAKCWGKNWRFKTYQFLPGENLVFSIVWNLHVLRRPLNYFWNKFCSLPRFFCQTPLAAPTFRRRTTKCCLT